MNSQIGSRIGKGFGIFGLVGLLGLLTLLVLAGPESSAEPPAALPAERLPQPAVELSAEPYRGITISCQTNGREWGSDAFAADLDRLKAMGVTAVAIHPYAGIRADGSVRWRWIDGEVPRYIIRPIEEARARGLKIMIKPHLAYWGSPFSWRGEIEFQQAESRARFFHQYSEWIVALAQATCDADVFVVGTELDRFGGDTQPWRDLIARVRKVTNARLTYAANWDSYSNISFWKDLDLIGIQAYFPLTDRPDPDQATLLKCWPPILAPLKTFSVSLDKPVLFTELGYNRGLRAAAEPWDHKEDFTEQAAQLQRRCLEAGLTALDGESRWFAGVFLWKWFAGPAPQENFLLNAPPLPEVIERAWKGRPSYPTAPSP